MQSRSHRPLWHKELDGQPISRLLLIYSFKLSFAFSNVLAENGTFLFLSPSSFTCDLDVPKWSRYIFKISHQVKYIGQRPFQSKVTLYTHTHQTHCSTWTTNVVSNSRKWWTISTQGNDKRNNGEKKIRVTNLSLGTLISSPFLYHVIG